jgi:hypothetical protein
MSAETTQSRCYAVQLQIDTFLDGDLTGAPAQGFIEHVGSCAACARELRFAQHLHERVLDMPMLDLNDAVVDELLTKVRSEPQQGDAAPARPRAEPGGFLPGLQGLRTAFVGLGGRGLALFSVGFLVLAVGVVQFSTPTSNEPQLADSQALVDTPAELESVRVALEDLNLAIDTLNRLSRKTESLVGGRFVLQPLREGVLGTVREAIYEPQQQDVRGPI